MMGRLIRSALSPSGFNLAVRSDVEHFHGLAGIKPGMVLL